MSREDGERFERVEHKLEHVEHKLEHLGNQMEHLENQMEHLEHKLEQHDARFDQHDARFDQHDARFDQHDARFDQHDARFDQHDARFDRLEKKLEQHDGRFHRVELKLEKIEGDVQLVLEGMHTGFESLRRNLQTQIDDLKARLELVEVIIRQNSRDLTSALTAIQENSSELRDLRAAIDRIDGKLDEKAHRPEVEALERRVSELEAEVLGKRS